MGVHNLAEYVKYHQEKLRQEQQAAQFTTSPSASSSQPPSQPKPKKRGVNQLRSKASFNTSVIEGSSGKVVLIDYFATWCGPCKAIAPKIIEMSNSPKYSDKVDFVKIDVDEVSDVAQEQGIRAMPTFAIFKDGEKVDEIVGANEKAIITALDKALAS